jgi:hypothetical protein
MTYLYKLSGIDLTANNPVDTLIDSMLLEFANPTIQKLPTVLIEDVFLPAGIDINVTESIGGAAREAEALGMSDPANGGLSDPYQPNDLVSALNQIGNGFNSTPPDFGVNDPDKSDKPVNSLPDC